MTKIFEYGLRMKDRSTPEGFEGSDPQVTHLLGGKQLAMAVYRCAKVQPNNQMVLQIIADAYPVNMRTKDLRIDVQCEIRDSSNTFHDGQTLSFQECLQVVPEAEAAWQESKTVTSRGAASKGEYSYRALYAKFIKENYKFYFKGWDFFEDCKVLADYLLSIASVVQEGSLFDRFVDMVQEHTVPKSG